MTAAQFFPQFVLYLGVGQARSSLACDQVLPTGVRPIFQIVIERYPLLGFSTLSVFLNLHAPGRGAKHGQIRFHGSTPWTRLWYVPPINRARNEAGRRLSVALYPGRMHQVLLSTRATAGWG